MKQSQLPGMPKPATGGKKPMPKWMLDQIKAEHPDAFNHNAHWQICRCGATVLTGADWTEDWCWIAHVDPAVLTTATELESLMAGRRTFEVIVRDDSKTIRSRDQWRIRGKPPETVPDYVFPAHRCNELIGTPIKPKHLQVTRKI